MFPNKKFGATEVVIIFISLFGLSVVSLFEFHCSITTTRYALTFSIIIGMLTGFISAIALLYFQQLQYDRKINHYYSEIAGHYKRVDIGQDNTGETEMENMKFQNLSLDIYLRHIKGSHNFKFTAHYWKNDGAKAEGTIEFNENNGNLAGGRYRYFEGIGYVGQSGTYKIYRLEEDQTKLLVLFRHLYPRKLEYNPDNNRGWEIWKKQ